jgi:hypothetical protein
MAKSTFNMFFACISPRYHSWMNPSLLSLFPSKAASIGGMLACHSFLPLQGSFYLRISHQAWVYRLLSYSSPPSDSIAHSVLMGLLAAFLSSLLGILCVTTAYLRCHIVSRSFTCFCWYFIGMFQFFFLLGFLLINYYYYYYYYWREKQEAGPRIIPPD